MFSKGTQSRINTGTDTGFSRKALKKKNTKTIKKNIRGIYENVC